MNWLYLIPIGIFLVGMAVAFLGHTHHVRAIAVTTLLLSIGALVWVITKG